MERGSGNFVEEVAAELPLQAIADLLGVPQEDRRKLFDWSNQMLANEDPDFEGASDVAAAEILGYAMAMAAERKENPRDDLVTRLLNADKDGRGLNDDEFGYFVIMLTVAGNETTRNAITHGMDAFLDHPDQWQLWLDERPDTMVDEVIRWATPINVFQRTALNDVEVGDVPVKKGQRVGLFYGSANYDDDVFDEPYTFDITRSPNPHVAFGGHGAHYCIGANLARQEVRLIFDALAEQAPDISQARRGRAGSGTAGSTASRSCRSPTPERSTSLAVGQHQRAVVGDGDGVLHVRAAGAVGAAQRPAVGVGEDLVGGLQEPRLDRDHQPRLELEAAARAAVVRARAGRRAWSGRRRGRRTAGSPRARPPARCRRSRPRCRRAGCRRCAWAIPASSARVATSMSARSCSRGVPTTTLSAESDTQPSTLHAKSSESRSPSWSA